MGKTNKQFRTVDEKQHHVFRAIKKEKFDESVRDIDRALQNKKYDLFFYDDVDFKPEKEYDDAK
jgi:hypothetical protein